MTWLEAKTAIRSALSARPLKSPKTRLYALESVERLLAEEFPGFRTDIAVIERCGRDEVSRRLARCKENGRLNSAERSILNNVFQLLGDGLSSGRGASGPTTSPVARTAGVTQSSTHKLQPFAELIAELLSERFGETAEFEFEVSHDWLDVCPEQESLGDSWDLVCQIYSDLVEGQWTLEARIQEHEKRVRRGPQRVDIWFGPPYSFAVEFDEEQHFNTIRLRTLVNQGYEQLPVDLAGYRDECERRPVRPGKTGFTRLTSYDPMFPPRVEGEKQDNRVRQRAFRDMLKDFVPRERRGVNPTWRIGSYVVANRRTGFTSSDCELVRAHIRDQGFIDSVEPF